MKHKELNSNLKFGEKKLFSELYSLRIRIRGRELLDESLYQPQQKETLENKLNNSFNGEREKCLAATILLCSEHHYHSTELPSYKS